MSVPSDTGDRSTGPARDLPWDREQVLTAVRALRTAYETSSVVATASLRERKKRRTRQEISDVATWMFCERGFDTVRIAEIAREVGVSEKTVYNYFPTKEALVLDREEDLADALRRVLGHREGSTSPTQAMIEMIEAEVEHYRQADAAARPMVLAFERLIDETPALRTAMREMVSRLVDVATEALAVQAQVDPRDPEPRIAAQALVGLWDIHLSSGRRHIREGLTGDALIDAIMSDTHRAARLLETGLWSFNSVVQGAKTRRQLADAAQAANAARKQVLEAIGQARAAWAHACGGPGSGRGAGGSRGSDGSGGTGGSGGPPDDGR